MTPSATAAVRRLKILKQVSRRRWIPALLSALTLVSGQAALAQATTTTTLFTTPNNPSSGAVVTMTAQVSSTQFTVAGGTVTFTDKYSNGTFSNVTEVLGTVQVQSTNGLAGTAILKTEVGGVGVHQFTAIYSGTSVFASSTSTPASVTFAAPYSTATNLAITGSGPYSMKGTVNFYGPVAPSGGSVNFVDSTTTATIGTAALDASTLQTGFAPSQNYAISGVYNATTGNTSAPAIGDFDGDGDLDYAIPTNAGPIVIELGNGDGTFTAGTALSPSSITAGFVPTSVVVGDFNGDGKQDLAALSSTGAIIIYIGKGDGTFPTASAKTASVAHTGIPASRFLSVGDFNRDGIQDLVATNSALNEVAVLLGTGAGTFLAPSYYSTVTGLSSAGSAPWNVAVGDLNKDGILDLAVASDGSSYFSVLQGKGDGTFKAAFQVNTTGSQVGSIAIGDFNADGSADIATTAAPNSNIYILTNSTATAGATPTFNAAKSYPDPNGPYYLTVADFNRDGKPDLIAANNSNATVSVFINNGSAGFPAANRTDYTVGAASIFANAADINGDDQIDLTAATSSGVSVLLSGESESATLSTPGFVGCGAQSIVATYSGDANYGTSTSSGVSETPSATATTLNLTVTPTSGVYGQQFVFTATLSPYNSGTTTTNNENVTFYINGGSAGTAKLNNGVATLPVTATATGNYTITASYGGDCAFAASNSNSVPATVLKNSTLSWSNPANITYGTPLGSNQLNATDNVAGTFAYTPAAGTILTVGSHTLSVTFTPNDPTYGQETTTVTINVVKANTLIIWPTPASISYGTPLSGVQLDAYATAGYVNVPLSSYYNANGIYDAGQRYNTGGFDNDGYSYSTASISGSISYGGMSFPLGPNNQPDAVYGTGTPIVLPRGQYQTLYLLGAMVNNISASQNFTVTYTDGTTDNFTQNMSDWFNAAGWNGETVAQCGVKRNYQDGSQQPDSVCVYAYQFNLQTNKTVKTLTIPNNRNIVFLSMNLMTPNVPGTFTYNPPAGTIEPVGTDPLSVTFTPDDATDYSSATGSVNIKVTNPVGTKSTTTISWSNPADIYYPTPLSSTQLNAVAQATARPSPVTPNSQLSVLSTSTDGTAFGLAGFDNAGDAYSYKLLNNGAVTYSGSTFTLGSPTVPNAITNGAVYTLSTPANYSTVYLIGAAIKDGQTSQPFVLTYNDNGNPVTQTLDMSSWNNSAGYSDETIVAATAYANTQGGGQTTLPRGGKYDLYGYQIPADPTRQLLSVSVPNNRNVVIMALGFGSNTPITVPGTYTYNPASGTVLNVGNHQTLSVSFTPTDTAAYTSATGTAFINVLKGIPIINWATPAAVPVGTALSSTQLNATASYNGTSLPGTFTYTPAAGTVENTPGTVTLSVLFTPSDTAHYSTATATVQLVVGNTGATGTTGGGSFQTSQCCFFSQPTPYVVTMTGNSVAPTGTVSVTFNGQTLGTGTLTAGANATSTASLSLNSIYFVPGNNSATINYGGDTNYVPTTTPVTIPLRNPAIQANAAGAPSGSSTVQIPYAFPRDGKLTFNFNPFGGSISDFSNNTSLSTCTTNTTYTAGTVCTFYVNFNPALPGIRRGAIQVNFQPSANGAAAEPTLYLFLSGLGNAAQISLASATQSVLYSGFNQPQSLTFKQTDTTNSTLYVANSNIGQLATLPSSGGTPTRYNAANSNNLQYPDDVVFDALGNLIVADSTAAKVWIFANSGAETSVNTGSSFTLGLPTAARVDFANNIYIADAGSTPRILQVNGETFDTTYTPSVLLSGSKVSFPQALAVDNSGNNLYVGDGDLSTIQQINLTTGAVTAVNISPCDATVKTCAFNSPGGMAFDPDGDMFVTDSSNRVLMIPYNHSSTAPTTQLPLTGTNNPTGIVLDGSGNVFISDLNTNVDKILVNSGAVTVGANKSITTSLTNTGNTNLTITGLAFAHNYYTETDTCKSATVAPGAQCTITIKATATTTTDTLTITSNAFSSTGVTIKVN